MTKYVYQFDDSTMKKSRSENFESRVGDKSGNFEEDYLDLVRLLLSVKRHGSVLDVGAGVGRITAIAREIASETVALEPDESRWEQCYRACHQPPRCEVLCQTTTEYLSQNPGKGFGLIVIGMVLQHVSTSTCDSLLEEAATLLKPDGIAVIFTTHTLEESKGFSFSGDPGNVYVSEQEFNDYANGDSSRHTKGLPVRRFSKADLIDTVSRYFEPLYWRQCAYYTEKGVAVFANRLQVDVEKLKDIGNSQFVVVQKRN